MTETTTNGRPKRKQLSEQLDRLDGIIDVLAEGLNKAVADAAREGTRLAVKDAILEILTNPELRSLIAPQVTACTARNCTRVCDAFSFRPFTATSRRVEGEDRRDNCGTQRRSAEGHQCGVEPLPDPLGRSCRHDERGRGSGSDPSGVAAGVRSSRSCRDVCPDFPACPHRCGRRSRSCCRGRYRSDRVASASIRPLARIGVTERCTVWC